MSALGLGLWVGRGQKSTVDYFLGGRSLPWWALLLSIVATETSTVTFLSVPGFVFAAGGDMTFLQITFGYVVGRILVAYLLLPLFFRGELFTSYEVLETRFGTATRRATSLLFLITRNVSDALRLYLSALAMREAIGLDFTTCVVGLGIITIAYTFFGGMKSVVWNDCVQFVIYMLGAVAALFVIVNRLPDGWEQLWQFGQESSRFRVLDFDFNLAKPTMTFWAGLIGGLFLTAATHGTDQMMVQRYLSAKSERSAGLAIIMSGLLVMAQFALFLFIGAALACFYQEFPVDEQFGDKGNDRVFAYFIVNSLPVGLVGLTIAAVLAATMSTLSSSLNSSATAFINDIYLPLRKNEMSAEQQFKLGQLSTAVFGVIQIIIALLSEEYGATQNTVGKVLSVAGFALGPMLGMYFLAVLTQRVTQVSALLGFACGIYVLVCVTYIASVHWAWFSAIGAVSTLLYGLMFSFLVDRSSSDLLQGA